MSDHPNPYGPLVVPSVNLNGSSAQSLAEQYAAAHAALEAARGALYGIVHPRDYPNGDWAQARAAMDARIRDLNTMVDEVLDLAIACHRQGR
jgi:hypothetical protein